MNVLLRICGWPHEMLHVLALRLIGRRPVRVRQTHVDIPEDLSTGQYVFVAGLPALVFWLGTAVSVQMLFSAPDVPRVVLWLALTVIFAAGAFGTLGDLMLIFARLAQSHLPDDYE